MVLNIKTAAEARADAQAWNTISSAPNSMGSKLMAFMSRLMEFQQNNPTALSVSIPANQNMVIPQAAVTVIQSTWGYTLTTVAASIPTGYNGNITNWVRVTNVAW